MAVLSIALLSSSSAAADALVVSSEVLEEATRETCWWPGLGQLKVKRGEATWQKPTGEILDVDGKTGNWVPADAGSGTHAMHYYPGRENMARCIAHARQRTLQGQRTKEIGGERGWKGRRKRGARTDGGSLQVS